MNVIYASEDIDNLDIEALRRVVLNVSNSNLDKLEDSDIFPTDCETALFYLYILSADLVHTSGIVRVTTDWDILIEHLPTIVRSAEMMDRLYAVCLNKSK